MGILLDTPILLWWLSDDPQLSPAARSRIANPAVDIFVSAATAWEIVIKQALGRLTIKGDLEVEVVSQGFEMLPITFAHAAEVSALPTIHRDPFDRMLVAQARVENLQLLTTDINVLRYPANVIEA